MGQFSGQRELSAMALVILNCDKIIEWEESVWRVWREESVWRVWREESV